MVSQRVLEVLGSNEETNPDTRAAMVMVWGGFCGAGSDRLVQLTGYAQEYVEFRCQPGSELLGLWQEEGTLNYDPWDDAEKGFVAFILDLEVATGRLVREGRTANGQYKFWPVKEADNPPNEDDVMLRSRREFKISRSTLRGRFRAGPFEIYPKSK